MARAVLFVTIFCAALICGLNSLEFKDCGKKIVLIKLHFSFCHFFLVKNFFISVIAIAYIF